MGGSASSPTQLTNFGGNLSTVVPTGSIPAGLTPQASAAFGSDAAAIAALIQSQNQLGLAEQQQAWRQEMGAIAKAQKTAAQQQGVAGNQAAQQQLQMENATQKATDDQAKSKQTAAARAAAGTAIGGQFDPVAQKAAAMANLGLISGSLPASPANSPGAPAANPAATTAANKEGSSANTFQMPSINGITFGGK